MGGANWLHKQKLTCIKKIKIFGSFKNSIQRFKKTKCAPETTIKCNKPVWEKRFLYSGFCKLSPQTLAWYKLWNLEKGKACKHFVCKKVEISTKMFVEKKKCKIKIADKKYISI